MAPRKRTDSKSPTTSTSHTSGDHHHLRHTGPSVSTRARTGTASSSKPPAQREPTPEGTTGQKEVSPAGARAPLTKFVYVLLICVLLLFAWYLYGLVTLLERMNDNVGWWSIVVGEADAEQWRSRGSRGGDVEGSLSALADVLGISPVQVASAVRPLVPQASLASMALNADVRGSSEAVRVLIGDTTPNGGRRDVDEDKEGSGF